MLRAYLRGVVASRTYTSRLKGTKPQDQNDAVYTIVGDSFVAELKGMLCYRSSKGPE